MTTEYSVQQGDTLLRIAKQHGFSRGNTIYDHPSNEPLRNLRPDPNILFPGDIVNIPDIKPLVHARQTGSRYTFTLKKPDQEKFSVKLQNKAGEVLQGKRVTLSVGDQEVDAELGPDGIVTADLPNGTETEGKLNVFMNANSPEPTHTITVQLGYLDPIDELSGVQARCNLLGHDCGVVDGIMGAKTREGVSTFQKLNSLDVDGVPGPITKGKLKEVYGC